jgi:hypothetical protein
VRAAEDGGTFGGGAGAERDPGRTDQGDRRDNDRQVFHGAFSPAGAASGRMQQK